MIQPDSTDPNNAPESLTRLINLRHRKINLSPGIGAPAKGSASPPLRQFFLNLTRAARAANRPRNEEFAAKDHLKSGLYSIRATKVRT